MSANSHYADAASRIYLQQADSAARAAEQRGQIWGGALTNIGKAAGQAVTQIQADRREGQIAAIFKQYGNDFDKALPEVYKIDPVLGHKIAKQVYEQKTWAHELQDLQWKTDGRTLLTLREKLANVTDQVGWSAYLAAAQQAGQNVSGYPPEFDPAAVAQLGKKLEEASRIHQGAAPTKPEPFSLSPGQKRFDAAGNEIASVPPTPDKPPQPNYEQSVYTDAVRAEQGAAPGGAITAPPLPPPPGGPLSAPPLPSPPTGPLTVQQVEGRAPAPTAPPTPPRLTEAQIKLEGLKRQADAKKKEDDTKHSPAYVEWQDYKANGGTLSFDAYMTQDANRKAVRVTTGGAEDRVLVPIIGPDGKAVLVPRSEAVGKTPASAGATRPVTSGDAGAIAELDTSLDDLKVLRETISTVGATGTAAKIGATVPNFVTEFTGWGADAKKKQALIDRVKQVIGKALEDGVLRKEDEAKYEKILPTIADANGLVLSKLDGLDKAVRQARRRKLEALSDAGYDTAKFDTRGAAVTPTTAAPATAAPAAAAPPPSAAAPPRQGYQRVQGPNGEKGQSPIGAPLPKGWTVVR